MTDKMSTPGVAETEPIVKVAAAPSRRKSSTAAKLIQAAALAAALVPLGSITAEASTCSFDASGATSCGIFGAGAEGFAFYDFADPGYKVALKFDHVIGEFEVTIDAFELTEAQALAKATLFPGFRPVPIGSNPLAPYIDFRVTAPTPCSPDMEDCSGASDTWISQGPRGPDAIQGYDMRFYWTAPTNAAFPNPHVLHFTGPTDDGEYHPEALYDFDMTDPDGFPYTTDVPCQVFETCVGDPAVGGCGS